jgi:hypothetical protein
MIQQPSSRYLISRPEMYRIRVRDLLDPDWSERLGGMTLSAVHGKPQETIKELTGRPGGPGGA